MTNPTTGQQPSIQPPRTQPGPPPAPAAAITYEDLVVSLVLGRGLVVVTAPEHTKASVEVLTKAQFGIRHPYGDRIRFGEQVEYEITGYDPTDCTLTLHLVHDWRPGQKDDPHAEPTDDLNITPYLVVHRYREHGTWLWSWRCWGDGPCDGHLALDLNNRAYAERNARRHLAEEHPNPTTPEQPDHLD